MDRIREMKIAIEDLQRMLQVPMSSAAAKELTNSVDGLKRSLKDEEVQLTRRAIDELDNLQRSVSNPMVAMLCHGLIKVLDKPEETVNSALIDALFECDPREIFGQVDQVDASPVRPMTCELFEPPKNENGTEAAPFASEMRDRKRSFSSPLVTKTLNIWSSEIRWDNDYNFVRIYLPIVNSRRTVTLADVTCSLLHLELGHRLSIKYPGVVFSVVINHSTITGVVEAHLSSSHLTVRLAKTDRKLWPFLTFVTCDSTHLTFHLNSQHHLRTRKDSALMMLIHRKKLDLSSNTCLPDKEYLDFIKSEHKINPWPILYEVCHTNSTDARNGTPDLFYHKIYECRCDTCLEPSVINEPDSTETMDTNAVVCEDPGESSTKNTIKELHTCDVWWDNDHNYVRIYLPIVDKSHVTLDTLTCSLTEFEFGHQLRVIYPGAIFSTSIHIPVDSIEVKILFDTIIIRLTKRVKGFWSYISLLTKQIEDVDSVTYHLNPHYHLKVKNGELKSMNKNLKNMRSLPGHILIILKTHGFDSSDEIFEIFREACILHDSKPTVDQGYCKMKTNRGISWS